MTEELMPLAERFGLWAALCCVLVGFILWFAWKRETRMASRIESLEDKSSEAATSVAKALHSNGEILKQVVSVQEDTLKEIRTLNVEMRYRPCLKEKRNA